MSELQLDSLEIKNFRCFEHLTIEKLGRVNLIVGKNSVGKTCLLEALQILASRADSEVLNNILIARNELFKDEEAELSQLADSFGNFFYNRECRVGESSAYIGSINTIYSVVFSLVYYTINQDESGENRKARTLTLDDQDLYDDFSIGIRVKDSSKKNRIKKLAIPRRNSIRLRDKNGDLTNFMLISTSGLDNNLMAGLWDEIALTPMEDVTISALRIINKDIEKYSFHGVKPNRYPRVKHKSNANPIPLRSLGEGLPRALGMALALVNAKNGWLLIDEFEIGLYHRIQADLWRMVFKLARELKIQVFATTHSLDCVKAFQEAAAEDQNETATEDQNAEAMLIRLARGKNGQIRAVPYDEEELAIATEQNIEVR